MYERNGLGILQEYSNGIVSSMKLPYLAIQARFTSRNNIEVPVFTEIFHFILKPNPITIIGRLLKTL